MEIKDLLVQDSHVLTETNHQIQGDPHTQYVGKKIDQMIKPETSTDKMAIGEYNYFCFASLNIEKDNPKRISMHFDVIDDYDGYSKSSSYVFSAYPNDVSTSSTAYYKNKIRLTLDGTDYARVIAAEENIDSNIVNIKLYVKTSNVYTQYNYSYVRVTYIYDRSNLITFNNHAQVLNTLPSADFTKSNSIITDSLITERATGSAYAELCTFDYDYNGASDAYVFEYIKIKDTAEVIVYAKIFAKIYSYGTSSQSGNYTQIRFLLLDSYNFKDSDIKIIYNSSLKKIYMYAALESGQRASLKLNNYLNMLLWRGRNIMFNEGKLVTSLPSGTDIKLRTLSSIPIWNTSNSKMYSVSLHDYGLYLQDENGGDVARMVNPRNTTYTQASDIITMRTDFNNLLDVLKTAGVLKNVT